MDIPVSEKTLKNLASINVIVGKNGCGKSTILRHLDQHRQNIPELSLVKYIAPERGGNLQSDSRLLDELQNDANWRTNNTRRNRVENFRQISMAEFRLLETLVLRSIESNPAVREDLSFTFDNTLAQINKLLDNIKLVRGSRSGFEIQEKSNTDKRHSDSLSSGESELVTLAIEILSFAYLANHEENKTKKSLLLLDEPDVHLHPDLQDRLMKLLIEATKDKPIITIMATHSTAILGALNQQNAHVYFMKKDQNNLTFLPIDQQLQTILPVFGAHPLSNIFNQNPILLVEGEDDERIWQTVVRQSEGKIKIWPCGVDGIDNLNDYEDRVSALIASVYDDAKAFSLRDRDNDPYEIDDKNYVTRSRLNCYAAENLILSDDVLVSLGTNWEQMKKSISDWLTKNSDHDKYSAMKSFAESFDRQNVKVKDMRLIFIDLAKSNKPWEVVVGQTISKLSASSSREEGSLANFLGEKIVTALNLCSST